MTYSRSMSIRDSAATGTRLDWSMLSTPKFHLAVLGYSILWVLPFVVLLEVRVLGLHLGWNLLLVVVPLVAYSRLRGRHDQVI
jgi:hypothetical protein